MKALIALLLFVLLVVWASFATSHENQVNSWGSIMSGIAFIVLLIAAVAVWSNQDDESPK